MNDMICSSHILSLSLALAFIFDHAYSCRMSLILKCSSYTTMFSNYLFSYLFVKLLLFRFCCCLGFVVVVSCCIFVTVVVVVVAIMVSVSVVLMCFFFYHYAMFLPCFF